MACQSFVSPNVAFQELVLRCLKASPLIKPFLTPGGWQEVKCVYWKVSVGLKCVRTSRMDSFLNLLPLHVYTHVFRNVISVSEISDVKFMIVLNQLLLGKRQENEISRPKTNNSRITHTSDDKSRVTCIQAFTNHVSF